jgi:hypothetical protein
MNTGSCLHTVAAPTLPIMTPDELMDRAADYIDAHGWLRGEAANHRGEVCVLAALASVGGDSAATLAFIEESIIVTTPQPLYASLHGWRIAKWNDNVCADQYEAAEFLRNQAKRYREENS